MGRLRVQFVFAGSCPEMTHGEIDKQIVLLLILTMEAKVYRNVEKDEAQVSDCQRGRSQSAADGAGGEIVGLLIP